MRRLHSKKKAGGPRKLPQWKSRPLGKFSEYSYWKEVETHVWNNQRWKEKKRRLLAISLLLSEKVPYSSENKNHPFGVSHARPDLLPEHHASLRRSFKHLKHFKGRKATRRFPIFGENFIRPEEAKRIKSKTPVQALVL